MKSLIINVEATSPVQLGLFLIGEGVKMKMVICFIIYFYVNQGQQDHVHQLTMMNVEALSVQLRLYFIRETSPFYNY